ncbi:hypothetical protein BZG36_04051 [Bifiguratus adelaidae]|uniref:Nuclear pore complex protein Nup153 n=1 Tax=Bifiguratus adelaidae TaxID=1938954 RepID=A0A261XWD8_9FUNG|nr:hypothetical protein BZG36_04051 [Bifiguratus adelaidae]
MEAENHSVRRERDTSRRVRPYNVEDRHVARHRTENDPTTGIFNKLWGGIKSFFFVEDSPQTAGVAQEPTVNGNGRLYPTITKVEYMPTNLTTDGTASTKEDKVEASAAAVSEDIDIDTAPNGMVHEPEIMETSPHAPSESPQKPNPLRERYKQIMEEKKRLRQRSLSRIAQESQSVNGQSIDSISRSASPAPDRKANLRKNAHKIKAPVLKYYGPGWSMDSNPYVKAERELEARIPQKRLLSEYEIPSGKRYKEVGEPKITQAASVAKEEDKEKTEPTSKTTQTLIEILQKANDEATKKRKREEIANPYIAKNTWLSKGAKASTLLEHHRPPKKRPPPKHVTTKVSKSTTSALEQIAHAVPPRPKATGVVLEETVTKETINLREKMPTNETGFSFSKTQISVASAFPSFTSTLPSSSVSQSTQNQPLPTFTIPPSSPSKPSKKRKEYSDDEMSEAPVFASKHPGNRSQTLGDLKAKVAECAIDDLPNFNFQTVEDDVYDSAAASRVVDLDESKLPTFDLLSSDSSPSSQQTRSTPPSSPELPKISGSWADAGWKPTTSAGWTCPTCGISNQINATKCIACETDAPVINKNKDPTPTSENQASWADAGWKPMASSGGWTCPVCSVSNASGATKCIACETDAPSQEKAKAAQPKTSTNSWADAGFTFKSSNGWTCPVCSVSNAAGTTQCIACESPAPQSKPSTATTATWADIGWKPQQAAAGSWTCPICSVSNNASATQCVACESPKP